MHTGDFLVRESAKIPGQFILSGRHKDQYKHLLLVDPEGIVRNRKNANIILLKIFFSIDSYQRL